MKKLAQPLLFAATLLLVGTAHAQAPTNTYQGNTPVSYTPPIGAYPSLNPPVDGAPAGTYSKDYNDYSQDSYVSQTGFGNYATVDQADNRTNFRSNGAGSTAVLIQNGDNNNATQRQTLADRALEQFPGVSDNSPARNFMKATQNGNASQTDQIQDGGNNNVMEITQGANTTGNRAIQSQTEYTNPAGTNNAFNQATITQTGSGNRAQQAQGGFYESGQINQAGSYNYASQVQQGYFNDATIEQGASGMNNTAIQSQIRDERNAYGNSARIRQAADGSLANNNYAMQNQTGFGNQADITQSSSGNFARQDQIGKPDSIGFYFPDNISVITQSNVSSAAYTKQSGTINTVTVTQH